MTKKGKPLVSVIIPCYNQGKYVCETLDSVRRQTFKDFECIIVNDGSTDDSTTKIKSFCDKDDRFKLIDKVNEGVSVARNIAIRNSRGQYILPLDSDDLIAPEYLEKTVNVFKNSPNVKVVYTDTEFFGAKHGLFKLPEYNFQRLLVRNILVCTAMFKRDDFDKTIGYNPNMNSGLEDWDFWITFLNDNDLVMKISEPLFFYRIKSSSRNCLSAREYGLLRKRIWENHKDKYANIYMEPKESEEYLEIYNSKEYKLGQLLLSPFRVLQSLIIRLRNIQFQ